MSQQYCSHSLQNLEKKFLTLATAPAAAAAAPLWIAAWCFAAFSPNDLQLASAPATAAAAPAWIAALELGKDLEKTFNSLISLIIRAFNC